nr:PolC-type DNA polymerase III [uncultured Oribacterium sp.]
MKQFFQVFQELTVSEHLRGMFLNTTISRITLKKDRSKLSIYLHSDHLLERSDIREMEEAIYKQLFIGKKISICIRESFHLSSQYTAKVLYEFYEKSLFEELKERNILLYQMMKQGELEWREDNRLSLILEEQILFRKEEKECVRVIQKIFEERCGVPIHFTIQFVPANKKAEEEEDKAIASLYSSSGNPGYSEEGLSDIYSGAEGSAGSPGTADTAIQDGEAASLSQVSSALSDGSSASAEYAGQGQDFEAEQNAGNKHSGLAKNTANATLEKKSAEDSPEQKKSSGEKSFEKKGFEKKSFNKGKFQFKRSDHSDVYYGRDFSDTPIPLKDIPEDGGLVTVEGLIIQVDERSTRSGKTIFSFSFTDDTDSLASKIFVEEENLEEARAFLKKDNAICIKGTMEYDSYDQEMELAHVQGIKKSSFTRKKREDLEKEKRVELHLHSKMSDMDGVSDIEKYIDRALDFGMPAMAITDHGVVQAFPDAMAYLKKIGRQKDLQLIYGMEGYLVNDLDSIVKNACKRDLSSTTVVFDLETTGFDPRVNHIIEIGAVKIENGKIIDRMDVFVNPGVPIPFRITQLTSIDDSMVMDAKGIEEVLPQFLDFAKDAILVAHNADFDYHFVSTKAKALNLPFSAPVIDTVALSRLLLPRLSRFKLDTVAKELKIELLHHHRAVDDAEATARIYLKELELLEQRGVSSLEEIDSLEVDQVGKVRKLPSYHIILLAKNDIGRINLYRLVSLSHLQYFRMKPRIPKSLLKKYREGLIIGSACSSGELFQAMVRGADDQQLLEIASFYDYLEIQPIGNNAYMLESDRFSAETEEDLIAYNKKIIALGEQLKKPVCATCDAHYADEENDVLRRIVLATKGMTDEEGEARLFFRSTTEMLEEFSYLDSNTQKQVVIDNPLKIMKMCEPIKPVRPDKCPPIIEHSDETLRQICYETAHKIYGPNLPAMVENRLETELNSIISNGYSVMYIIAQKLVDKSNEDGYLVGSRGSVGSSFAATMAHITEVNPLPPHYVCPKCYYTDFDSEEVKSYSGMAGYDMPSKNCPHCGTVLNRLGFDIPFETFLGFDGDKEPDIDLNFSGEYQARAHAYTGAIFGEENTYKAGTIGTLAEKTAYGMIKKFYEERGEKKRTAELNRLVEGITGIRRTTGQHPGGIVVLPHGEDINTFTPVQHPANDTESPIITTHFDYHKIDHNLLKLDILGHDDPTMIRKLQDLTGLDPVKDIPLDSPEVMSLFQSTEALGISPADIQGVELGCLGIPEFGTQFAMQMVQDTKPKYLSDLIRISGLSHGTDVYLNNAQDLILSGVTTLREAICCRDDIMVYLMHMGLEPGESFNIMEATRKHKPLKDEWCEHMLEHGVPQWYIDACKKIKYMFPKAHAAAYVMMAYRVAYCKVFYPKEYYTAYYTVRADGFDFDKMCFGVEKLRFHIKEYSSREKLSNTDALCLRDMKICEEMYARGIHFAPLDIYKAKAKDFQITEKGEIMPSFSCIAGLGEAVAQGLEEGAKYGKYLSKDDFIQRTHCPKAFADKFHELGLLGDIPLSNQMSLFDF